MVLRISPLRMFRARMGAEREQLTFGCCPSRLAPFYITLVGSNAAAGTATAGPSG
jgi:hypothetical protein